MPIAEIGKIGFFSHNIIVWEIPSMSLLLRGKGDYIYSPKFLFSPKKSNNVAFKNCAFQFEPLPDYIGLIISCPESLNSSNRSFTCGVVNINFEEISQCNCEWIEVQDNSVHLRGRSTVKRKEIEKVDIRVFIQESSKQLERGNGKENIVFGSNFRNQDFDVVTYWSPESENHVFRDPVHAPASSPSSSPASSPLPSPAPSPLPSPAPSPPSSPLLNLKLQNECLCSANCHLENLSQDFKELFNNGKYSDLTIEVGKKKFSVHKAVLGARSQVFDEKFSINSSQSVLTIENYNSKAFEAFLSFIYTGRTGCVAQYILCELYYIAHEYAVQDLKQNCVQLLKDFLAIDIICDVIFLCTKHNELDLLEHATVFFSSHMDKILKMEKWYLFIREYPTKACELIDKAMNIGYIKRDILKS